MVPMETLDAVSYSTSIEVMAVSSAVSTQFTNVTDGQTLHDGTGGVYAWHRAEKKIKLALFMRNSYEIP